MNTESNEYSLGTPKYNFYGLENDNILNSKIIKMLKNNNMSGGSGSGFISTNSSYIIMIIGIIIIVIGIILYNYNNDLNLTEAKINNFVCDNSQCKIDVTYNVKEITYNKTIILENSYNPKTSTITIYYQISNPNIIRLHNFNYNLFSISLMITGILIILSVYILPLLSLSELNTSINTNINTSTNKNLHSYTTMRN